MVKSAKQGPSTTAVHAGEGTDLRTGAVNIPVTLSTTYRYPELEDGSKAPYIYSRYENPSVEATEQKIAALEGADKSLLFASGMAATQTACAFLRPGDILAYQRGIYGGTTAHFIDNLAPMGIKLHPFDAHAKPKLPEGTKLVWLESITNPLLRVVDVTTWAEAAHEVGARVAVDATFATPLLQRPLDLGADVVMHSATKYLGGHSDVSAGVLSCRNELWKDLWTHRRNTGGTLDPHASYLLGRGMKTLAVRLERHCENAMALAKACRRIKGIKVHYPGLSNHPDHKLAKSILHGGFGGMLTLDLGSLHKAQSFRRKIKLITPAASLGGVESLVSLPLETSHAYASAESRKQDGITDGLIRISVGIEDVEDLLADLTSAVK